MKEAKEWSSGCLFYFVDPSRVFVLSDSIPANVSGLGVSPE